MSRIECFFLEDTGKQTKWNIVTDEKGKRLGRSRDRIFRRADTGEEITGLNNAPVGAMWFADWLDDHYAVPQLEHVLVVKTPGGDWVVDGQSSNCTLSDDVRQERHHCWIIEGKLPDVKSISVTKNGNTCQAGAGSILIGNYHGFLRNGWLEAC